VPITITKSKTNNNSKKSKSAGQTKYTVKAHDDAGGLLLEQEKEWTNSLLDLGNGTLVLDHGALLLVLVLLLLLLLLLVVLLLLLVLLLLPLLTPSPLSALRFLSLAAPRRLRPPLQRGTHIRIPAAAAVYSSSTPQAIPDLAAPSPTTSRRLFARRSSSITATTGAKRRPAAALPPPARPRRPLQGPTRCNSLKLL